MLEQTYGSSYAKGVSWLQAQTPQSVAYAADRAGVLGSAGESVNVLVAAMDASMGAWGGYDGYATNILDTAAALRALKAVSYSDVTLQNAALAFLTTSQNADGGWGFNQGTESDIFITSTVSATLQQFPQMASIATAVSKAGGYLLAHQNADGSFGSPATPYETALGYIALVGDGQTQGLPLQNAVNYLTSTQSANGSWNDDPYSTALAVKALHFSENKPSPPPPPPPGGRITGTVIDATTKAPVSGVAVAVAGNPLIYTTTDPSGNFTLHDVPSGSQTVRFSLSQRC